MPDVFPVLVEEGLAEPVALVVGVHGDVELAGLFVDEPSAFEEWARVQSQPARPDSAGYQTFLASGCAACHAIDGTAAQGRVGPDLTHVGSRASIAAGMFPNEPEWLAAWLRSPDSMKPGALMPDLNLSEGRVTALVRMLEGLR